MSGVDIPSYQRTPRPTLPVTPAVYAITHRHTWHRYIGSTINPERRWIEHRTALNHNKHRCAALQQAWTADGEAAFIFEVLMPSRDLKTDEQHIIVHHRQAEWPLYNTRAATRTAVTTQEEVEAACHDW